MWIGLMSKGKMDAAKPSYQEEYGRKFKTPWDDLFIDEIKRALVATRAFVAFPIYWVVYNQMTTNLVSQGKNRTFCRGVAKFIKEDGSRKCRYGMFTKQTTIPVLACHTGLYRL